VESVLSVVTVLNLSLEFIFLRFRNQNPQITQIVSRRPGNDYVLES